MVESEITLTPKNIDFKSMNIKMDLTLSYDYENVTGNHFLYNRAVEVSKNNEAVKETYTFSLHDEPEDLSTLSLKIKVTSIIGIINFK